MFTLKNILVATDFSECSESALHEAFDLASALGARVHLVHVIEAPLHELWTGYVPADDYVGALNAHRTESRERLAKVAARHGGPPGGTEFATLYGPVVDQILEYARTHDIDLVVCGTHGRRGVERLVMGSVAERLVHGAPCPVLTVAAKRTKRAPAA